VAKTGKDGQGLGMAWAVYDRLGLYLGLPMTAQYWLRLDSTS
jgi:hypothetical protein